MAIQNVKRKKKQLAKITKMLFPKVSSSICSKISGFNYSLESQEMNNKKILMWQPPPKFYTQAHYGSDLSRNQWSENQCKYQKFCSLIDFFFHFPKMAPRTRNANCKLLMVSVMFALLGLPQM